MSEIVVIRYIKIYYLYIFPGFVRDRKLLTGKIITSVFKFQLLGVESKPGEKRILTSRCAHLIAVAMANKLDEVWITFQPELFYCYLFQYLPLAAFR